MEKIVMAKDKKNQKSALEKNGIKAKGKSKAEKIAGAKKGDFREKQKIEIDPWAVLLYPHMAEKSMSLVDLQNKLVFVVRRSATKPEIKESFEKLFSVKVQSVGTETTIGGEKKAYIKLHPDNSAADIATRLGIL